jgi:hypothetical protein
MSGEGKPDENPEPNSSSDPEPNCSPNPTAHGGTQDIYLLLVCSSVGLGYLFLCLLVYFVFFSCLFVMGWCLVAMRSAARAKSESNKGVGAAARD